MLLVFLIGYSRMFFGFHYFSDVVGGYAAGLFWLALCLSIRGFVHTPMRIAHAEEIPT